MDSFLEAQINRIRALAAKMSSLEARAAELSSEMERERQSVRRGPLQDVRDFRTYSASREPSAIDDPSRQPRARRNRKRRR
jgi:hypothetical protein